MVSPRPVHLVAFLVALAVAGCAITGDQPPQTSAGAALSRPTTVLVYDLDFSPDIAVVDREFTTRLAREIGDISISNQLVGKRVNAEIVATIIAILRYEAGLNVRPGIDDDPALKNTALIVSGRLQPAARAARTAVNFTGDVAAEITLSRASESAKSELLNFTVQAQKGAAFTGQHAAAQNAAIKTVLASESVPTQNLSPEVEARARGLGRAIADKITAYALQQGWANKADLPEQPVDARSTKNKPQNLPARDAKPDGSTIRSDAIPCDAFTKNERGNWYVNGPVNINLGSVQNKTLQNLEITPKFFNIGGVDLYEAVQKECGGKKRP